MPDCPSVDAAAWDARYGRDELLWTPDANPILASELDGVAPGRALDLGAGEGRNSLMLARRGWAVTAVGFSEVALTKGRRRAEAEGLAVRWVAGDITTVRPPRGSLDLVLLSFVHLEPRLRRRVLRRAARSLRPGGSVVVVGYDPSNLGDGWRGPQDPVRLFTPDDVLADLPGLVPARADRVLVPVGGREVVDTFVRAFLPSG